MNKIKNERGERWESKRTKQIQKELSRQVNMIYFLLCVVSF